MARTDNRETLRFVGAAMQHAWGGAATIVDRLGLPEAQRVESMRRTPMRLSVPQLACSIRSGLALVVCVVVQLTMAVAAEDGVTSASFAWLADVIDPAKAEHEFARPARNQNAAEQPMRIAGRDYARGVGMQLETTVVLVVNGATHFSALAGVDDASDADAGVIFEVQGDGRTLWRSDPRYAGHLPELVDVELSGVRELRLSVYETGHALTRALANWAEARFTLAGAPPQAIDVPRFEEPATILTPRASPEPRINSARVFGVRPWRPFLFTIAASGERPMVFAAEGLPAGLELNPANGQIRGAIGSVGTHTVTLSASNRHGRAEQQWRIVVGEEIALTPPLGWNSWNCWGAAVDQDKVARAARAMVNTGMSNFGWTYINIDDGWQAPRPGENQPLPGNEKFPNMQALADEVHTLGLKIGIYSTPWVGSYAVMPGGSADTAAATWTPPPPRVMNQLHPRWYLGRHSFAAIDARQWSAWGFDYLKYDWNPNEVPETREMFEALKASGRDVVLSLANTTPLRNVEQLAQLANSWRTTGDIEDTWGSVLRIALSQEKWRPYARPGHWNDPDMLVVGMVGWGPDLHPARLTPNEQYLHVSLWSLLAAPLLVGCDLEQLDAFTLSLLTNAEVLAVNQDPLGEPAARVVADGRHQIWVKRLEDGSRAIGLFNFAREPGTIGVTWAQLGLNDPQQVRDLWRQEDVGVHETAFVSEVPRHGVRLIRVSGAAIE